EQIPSQKKRILGVDQLTEGPTSSGQKDLVFVKSLADDKKVSIPGVERPWLSEAEGFILPNHDTSRILPVELQRNITDPPVHPFPPLKKLDGAEPVSGPKTIKSILRSKSTFKAKTLKGIIINEPSLAHTKGNKSSPASKVNSTPAERSIQEILNTPSKDVKLVVAQLIPQLIIMILNGSEERHARKKRDPPYVNGNDSYDMEEIVMSLHEYINHRIAMDLIHNGATFQDKYRRLQQTIKCGLVKRFTVVGEIQDKAVSLQHARLNDVINFGFNIVGLNVVLAFRVLIYLVGKFIWLTEVFRLRPLNSEVKQRKVTVHRKHSRLTQKARTEEREKMKCQMDYMESIKKLEEKWMSNQPRDRNNGYSNGNHGGKSKRRAVLKEVTNIPFNDLNVKTSKQMRSVTYKKAMVAPDVYVGPQVEKRKAKATEEEDYFNERIKNGDQLQFVTHTPIYIVAGEISESFTSSSNKGSSSKWDLCGDRNNKHNRGGLSSGYKNCVADKGLDNETYSSDGVTLIQNRELQCIIIKPFIGVMVSNDSCIQEYQSFRIGSDGNVQGVAPKKRSGRRLTETDEYVSGNGEGILKDPCKGFSHSERSGKKMANSDEESLVGLSLFVLGIASNGIALENGNGKKGNMRKERGLIPVCTRLPVNLLTICMRYHMEFNEDPALDRLRWGCRAHGSS
ncbi:hypothetical protein Tco_0209511, partial [Tanacetum coccineum]